jgi:hypothetical protein
MNVFVSCDACLQAEGKTFPTLSLNTDSDYQTYTAIHWTKQVDPDLVRTGVAASAALHTFTQNVSALSLRLIARCQVK